MVAACAGLSAGSPGGGALKWLSGSATPQNTSPMPMPAAKSIANHEPSEKSGSSSPSFASTTLPMWEAAIQRAKKTNPATIAM